MGNTGSASGPHRSGSVLEHVEHAGRTGVCVLQKKDLALVSLKKKERGRGVLEGI